MESEGSSPYSQDTTTCPYPTPDQSTSSIPFCFLTTHFNIILSSMLRYSQWFLTSHLPIQTLHGILPSPIHGTCPKHQIVLDLITLVQLGKEYKSCSSLYNFLQSHVTSYPLMSKHLPQHPIL
jgi:hypothetical protein